MLDEALEVIAGLWTGAPFSFHGEHYRVEEITFLPAPVQQPRIPIWIGGGYPDATVGGASSAANREGRAAMRAGHRRQAPRTTRRFPA